MQPRASPNQRLAGISVDKLDRFRRNELHSTSKPSKQKHNTPSWKWNLYPKRAQEARLRNQWKTEPDEMALGAGVKRTKTRKFETQAIPFCESFSIYNHSLNWTSIGMHTVPSATSHGYRIKLQNRYSNEFQKKSVEVFSNS